MMTTTWLREWLVWDPHHEGDDPEARHTITARDAEGAAEDYWERRCEDDSDCYAGTGGDPVHVRLAAGGEVQLFEVGVEHTPVFHAVRVQEPSDG